MHLFIIVSCFLYLFNQNEFTDPDDDPKLEFNQRVHGKDYSKFKIYAKRITWKMNTNTGSYSYTKIRPLIANAVSDWAKIIKTEIFEVQQNQKSVIQLIFPNPDEFRLLKLPKDAIAFCKYDRDGNFIFKADIFFKPGFSVENSIISSVKFQAMVNHEFGHALGLSDVSDGVDIMNHYLMAFLEKPLYRDSRRIIEFYGKKDNFILQEPCNLTEIIYVNGIYKYILFNELFYEMKDGLVINIHKINDVFLGRTKLNAQFFHPLRQSYIVFEDTKLYEYKELFKQGTLLKNDFMKINGAFFMQGQIVYMAGALCYYSNSDFNSVYRDNCEMLAAYGPLKPLILPLRNGSIILSYANGNAFIVNGLHKNSKSIADVGLRYICLNQNNNIKVIDQKWDLTLKSKTTQLSRISNGNNELETRPITRITSTIYHTANGLPNNSMSNSDRKPFESSQYSILDAQTMPRHDYIIGLIFSIISFMTLQLILI